MRTLRFANDTRQRDRLMVPDSYQHPAKGHMGMWQTMIDLYTKPGDTVLDPMAGVGSTLLAALMGRNVVCVELETHFHEMLKANWEKMRQHPMMGYELGNVTIIQGDARNLTGLLADVVLTSPPYADSPLRESFTGKTTQAFRSGVSFHGNFGLRKGYTRPSAIVTSPPYDEGLGHGMQKTRQIDIDKHLYNAKGGRSYTRPSAIVTSPPYQMENPGLDSGTHDAARAAKGYDHDIRYSARGSENIGNMKGGDLYALLVYNGITQNPDAPVEVYICERCGHAEIAGSQLAPTTPAAIPVRGSSTPNTAPRSKPTLSEDTDTTTVPAEPKSAGSLTSAAPALPEASPADSKASPNPLNGERRLGPLTMGSPTPSRPDRTTSTGLAVVPLGGDMLGASSAVRPLNETATDAPDVAHRNGYLSIISRVQKRLEANGITASAILPLSVGPAMERPTVGSGCILCNASLAGASSSHGVPTPSIALSLQLVEPRLTPPDATAGRQSGYWGAMNEVYSECYAVLRPGGVLALVLKGFTRDGQYVDLPAQTAALCESLDFVQCDHWRRELASLSFWRILQGTDKEETVIAQTRGLFDVAVQDVKQMKRVSNGKLDERLRFEEVLAFHKPAEGDGGCVDHVLTSPPYEGSVNTESDGIDWTKQADGRKKQEPHGVGTYGFSYTRPKEG